MTDIVKGMVFAFNDVSHWNDEEAMRAALLWLSDHVTEEMAHAAYVKTRETDHLNNMHQCIAAAIQAAAGSEG